MVTIWKYALQPNSVQTVNMPIGAVLISIQVDTIRDVSGVVSENPWLYAIVDSQAKVESRLFRVYSTGESIGNSGDYVGTFKLYNRQIFHVFESTVPNKTRARLDKDRTAKPLTEIRAIVEAGAINMPHNVERYVVRSTTDDLTDVDDPATQLEGWFTVILQMAFYDPELFKGIVSALSSIPANVPAFDDVMRRCGLPTRETVANAEIFTKQDPPRTMAQYRRIMMQSGERLEAMGLRAVWNNGRSLWLFPKEWAETIPEGLEGIDIHSGKYVRFNKHMKGWLHLDKWLAFGFFGKAKQ